jgi:xanthine dehydrogenase YagS FAD-binding subunit
VSVAAVIDASNGKVNAARLAFGGLAPKPWRVPGAETALQRGTDAAKAAGQAADAVLDGAKGHGHNDFKIALTRRALGAVVAQALRA